MTKELDVRKPETAYLLKPARSKAMRKKVIIVGARRAREGIGEYVAAWFARHDIKVCAIVGTCRETVDRTRLELRQAYGIECRGYVSLQAALATEHADFAAICSPYRYHAEHLRLVARAGMDCLCEKPLFDLAETDGLGEKPATVVEDFARGGQYLSLITQWPFTLDFFFQLHEDQCERPIERFEMGLGPTSMGAEMVPDAAPHMLSMIRRLVGSGTIADLRAVYAPDDLSRLRMTFVYHHATGTTDVDWRFTTCAERPRPAWYAINGARVDREIEMASYEQRFCDEERSVVIEDPLKLLVGEFLSQVKQGAQTDVESLLEDQRMLTSLYRAAQEAAVAPSANG